MADYTIFRPVGSPAEIDLLATRINLLIANPITSETNGELVAADINNVTPDSIIADDDKSTAIESLRAMYAIAYLQLAKTPDGVNTGVDRSKAIEYLIKSLEYGLQAIIKA